MIIFTEANISDDIICLYNIQGYQMYKALRKFRKGGGSLLYFNNRHKSIVKTVNTNSKILYVD